MLTSQLQYKQGCTASTGSWTYTFQLTSFVNIQVVQSMLVYLHKTMNKNDKLIAKKNSQNAVHIRTEDSDFFLWNRLCFPSYILKLYLLPLFIYPEVWGVCRNVFPNLRLAVLALRRAGLVGLHPFSRMERSTTAAFPEVNALAKRAFPQECPVWLGREPLE